MRRKLPVFTGSDTLSDRIKNEKLRGIAEKVVKGVPVKIELHNSPIWGEVDPPPSAPPARGGKN